MFANVRRGKFPSHVCSKSSKKSKNTQNIIQNTPIPEDIGDVPSELDSLL